MNCVLYARVSTDKQAEKELSIPAQLRAMREYSERHGWVVVAEYEEPGASAKTAARPALQRLLADIGDARQPVGVVLVHKIDRLARNVYDHATIRALLKRNNVTLASVVENVDDSVSGQLVENIMASIAQFYSANLAEEVRKGMRQKVLNGGWPHKVPRGYKQLKPANGSRSEVEIDSHDGPLIRKAFELYSTGWYSIKAVAATLATEGLTCKTGRPIAPQYLRDLLSNPFYIGRLRWKDVEAIAAHTPLVSQELFDQVQGVMRRRFKDPRAKGGTNGFPLRGIARCAFCRGHMTAGWQRSGWNARRWGYYRCARRTYDRGRCDASRGCPVDKAHVAVTNICGTLRMEPQLVDSILVAAHGLLKARAEEASARTASLQMKRAKLRDNDMRLTEVFLAGDLPAGTYRDTAAKLRAELSQVEAELENADTDTTIILKGVQSFLQQVDTVAALGDRLDDGRHTQLLRGVFKSVVLDETGVVGFALRPPFDALRQETRAHPDALAAQLIDSTLKGVSARTRFRGEPQNRSSRSIDQH